MERKSAFRHGLVGIVAPSAFHMMTTAVITIVHTTEVKRACLTGMGRRARRSVSLKMTMNLATTLVTATATKSAMMASMDSV